jgi:predicted aldo/keto reductase-like oxidoreductase
MDRRAFLATGSAALLAADSPMPVVTLGKSGLKVSKFCLGGYHMRVGGQDQAVQIIHRAMDLGVTFFDSAAKYHEGESDVSCGVALKGGRRQKVILMSKAQLRDRDGAMKQLETTLQRMQTDYLDLWQCHEVATHAEVDKIFGPKGSLEAFVAAKKQGKVRHIGFTGHHDPTVHQRLLEGFDGWETVQMPVNLIDRHYLSFIENVLPRVKAKGLGMIAMKSNAMGPITKNRIATIEECLRYTLSQPVDVLVSGVETVPQLEQNVSIVKSFRPMSSQELTTILDRTKKGPHGSKIENYKRPEAGAFHRLHHDGEPV